MENITVVKEFTFDAAHFLPNYDGPCKRMHGHTYKLQVGVRGLVNSQGFVVDFNWLKNTVKEAIVDKLDHQLLNEIDENFEEIFSPSAGPYFPSNLPTAERLVEWMVMVLMEVFAMNRLDLVLVRLWETPTSYAEWVL